MDMEKTDLQIGETSGLRDRLESKVTPRFLAVEEEGLESLPIVMVYCDRWEQYFKWMKRNSVLLSLSLKTFRGIQHCMLAMHAPKWAFMVRMLEKVAMGSQARHSWELLAYK